MLIESRTCTYVYVQRLRLSDLSLFFNGFFKLYKLETTSYFGLYCQAFSKSISYLQYHEIYILVSYLFKIVRTRPMHLTTFRVNIWGYFIPTLINRVKYIISKYHETFIQLSYLFRIVRTRPMHLTTFRVNIWGYFIPPS